MLILLWVLITILIIIPMLLICAVIFSPIYLVISHSTQKFGNLFSATISWWNETLGIGIFRIENEWILKLFFKKQTIKKWDIELDKEEKIEKEQEKKPIVKEAKKIKLPTKQIRKGVKKAFTHKPAMPKEKVIVFFRRFWHSFALDKLNWKCVYGFRNPANTGMTYGWSQALEAIFYNNKKINLSFQADFLNLSYEGDVRISTIFKPYMLLWAFFPFIIEECKKKSIKEKKDKIKLLDITQKTVATNHTDNY